MGFGKLTRERNEYQKRKEERAKPLKIKISDFRRLISNRYAAEILEQLAQRDMTMGEIKEHTEGKPVNYFLMDAKKAGIVERYFNKKARKYYFRLILHETKGLSDPEDRKVQLRLLKFLIALFLF